MRSRRIVSRQAPHEGGGNHRNERMDNNHEKRQVQAVLPVGRTLLVFGCLYRLRAIVRHEVGYPFEVAARFQGVAGRHVPCVFPRVFPARHAAVSLRGSFEIGLEYGGVGIVFGEVRREARFLIVTKAFRDLV